MILRPLFFACFTSLGSTQAAAADEWVFGLGGADLLDNVRKEAAAVLLEYHSDPFHAQNWSQFSWMATAKLDTTNNHFIGFGVHAFAPLNNKKAFLEASFAVGGYHQGTLLGKKADPVLFRSSLGGGVTLKNGNRVSITIDHLLDGDLKNERPGKESIMLRYARSF